MYDKIDILLVTYNRPEYTELTLNGLLKSCDSGAKIWIWQNGSHTETMNVVSKFKDHPSIARYYHSKENVKLREPTNWILSEGTGELVAKVDDDSLVPLDWLKVLRAAHRDEPVFGALACWHFLAQDFSPKIAEHKVRTFRRGHRIMCHPWVQGSGIVFKRACADKVGKLRNEEAGLTKFLMRIAASGWVNGWYLPLLLLEHMDDPRAPHTLIKSDADLLSNSPLSASYRGSVTVEQWDKQLRASALELQTLPSDVSYYTSWRSKIRRGFVKAKKIVRSSKI